MDQPRRSLRTELLVNLGFVASAAVILVGVNTVLLLGGDLGEAWRPLLALWGEQHAGVRVLRLVPAPPARDQAAPAACVRGRFSGGGPARP